MGEGLPIEIKLPLAFASASTLSFSAAFEAISAGEGLGPLLMSVCRPSSYGRLIRP
jgi:hypothetical protein